MSHDNDLIQNLLTEYLQRREAGEHPAISEYCDAHPELADEIRARFPTASGPRAPDTVTYPPEASLDEVTPPTQIGDYQIIGEIGRGGMGVVYEAEQASLDRRVALKVLPSRISASSKAKTRFQREARAAARMHHTNIVPVFEIGDDGEYAFYAMQLIEGRPLDEIIQDLRATEGDSRTLTSAPRQAAQHTESIQSAPTPQPDLFPAQADSLRSGSSRQFFVQIAELGHQVADALEFAHARGVVHRDIKPSNLILDRQNVVWVTDFGLAKSEEDDETLTQTGDFLGTLRYMSPERFRGECTLQTDIYALGMTLYELVAQKPAFDSPHRMKLIYQITETEPPRPTSIDPTVPRDLETILLKAIEKNPRQRYRSAEEFKDDLFRFIHDVPILARRVTAVEQFTRWARRNQKFAALLTAFVLLLVVVAVGSSIAAGYFQTLAEKNESLAHRNSLLLSEATKERDVAEDARRQAESAEATARAAEEAALANEEIAREKERQTAAAQAVAVALAERNERELYAAQMILAANQSEKPGAILTIRQLLKNWVPENGQQKPDRRGPEWYFLNGLGRSNITSFGEVSGQVVRFRPDGRAFAAVDNAGTLTLNAVDQAKTYFRIAAAHRGVGTDVRFSADGQVILTTGEDGTARLWQSTSGERLAELKDHGGRVFCARFSPDQRWIATGAEDGLRLWDARTYQLRHHIQPATQGQPAIEDRGAATNHIADLDWHPDSNQLVTLSKNDTMGVWSAESGQFADGFAWINKLPELQYWFGNASIRWSPAGDRLLACGITNAVIHLPQGGQPPRGEVFDQRGGAVTVGDWTADGERIVLAGRSLELELRDADSLQFLSSIRGHESAILDFDLHPNGRQILSASRNNNCRLWNLPGEPIAAEGGVAISPDSQKVAVTGGSRNEVSIIELATGEVLSRFSLPESSWVGFVEWSADSSRIAVAYGNAQVPSRVYVYEAATAQRKQTLDVSARYIQSLAWHPAESLLAVAQNSSGPMEFWDPDSGELLDSRDEFRSWAWNTLAWSPNGAQLAIAGWRPQLVNWKDRRIAITLTQPHTQNTSAVDYHPDGGLLATAAADGLVCIYNAETNEHLLTLAGHAGPVTDVAWGVRTDRIATIGADNTLRIWEIDVAGDGRSDVVLSLDAANARSLNWSDDGRYIAVSVARQLKIMRMSE